MKRQMQKAAVILFLIMAFWSIWQVRVCVLQAQKEGMTTQISGEFQKNAENEEDDKLANGLLPACLNEIHSEILFYEILFLLSIHSVLIVVDYQPRKLTKDYYGAKV